MTLYIISSVESFFGAFRMQFTSYAYNERDPDTKPCQEEPTIIGAAFVDSYIEANGLNDNTLTYSFEGLLKLI